MERGNSKGLQQTTNNNKHTENWETMKINDCKEIELTQGREKKELYFEFYHYQEVEGYWIADVTQST